MSSKRLAGIIGDYTSSDQGRHHSNSTAPRKAATASILQDVCQVPTPLLTPPVSDAEPEILPNRHPNATADGKQHATRIPLMPVLNGLSREEQVVALLERKRMLEAYLQALANPGHQDFGVEVNSTQNDSPVAQDDRLELPPPSNVRVRKARKVSRVRRVRLAIQHSTRQQAAHILHIAYVNTIRVLPEPDSPPEADKETDEEAEEEIVFKPFRRSGTSRTTINVGESRMGSEPLRPEIQNLRTQLLQSHFAHLLSTDAPRPKSPQTLPNTPKVDHALISRQLRSHRQKNAINAGNNPIRYPRGQVVKPSALSHHIGLDTSDGETSSAYIDLPVILVSPRPEILDRIESVARSLQESFPLDAEFLEPFIRNPIQGLTMVDANNTSETGEVFWDNGVGKLHLDDDIRETIPAGDVHIFMDHSNVFLSLIATLRDHPPTDLPRHKRKVLSLPVLSLILQRGRAVRPRGMHLAGSSPLMQSFDSAIKLGWECSVLKRVPAGAVMYDLKRGAIDDAKPKTKKSANWNNPVKCAIQSCGFAASQDTQHLPAITASEYDTISSSDTELDGIPQSKALQSWTRRPQAAGSRTNENIPPNSNRMKEQAVDELLHLKMLQTILAHRGKRPGTIVLATGDARGGQYNEHGFLGCVREAISRGWNVELWAFENGMSRSWLDCARRESWLKSGRFAAWSLDHYVRELTQVVE